MMKGIQWRINGQHTSDLQAGAAMLRMADQYQRKRAWFIQRVGNEWERIEWTAPRKGAGMIVGNGEEG
jgi:hypothetical protein